MKRLKEIAARINARSLRERLLGFALLAALAVFSVEALVLGPQQAKQKQLQKTIDGQEAEIAVIEAQVSARLAAFEVDPDAPARARLASLQQEMAHLGQQLQAVERGLVPPDRMTPLLDAMLRRHGRLGLVSLRTLDVVPLSSPRIDPESRAGAPAAGAASAGVRDARAMVASVAAPVPLAGQAPAGRPALLYRHGVEITVRGSYHDMLAYMTALEALPTRMFWGQAHLEVEQYPNARLTLTLHTLSLDKQWMTL